jgi:poly(A) polymerase
MLPAEELALSIVRRLQGAGFMAYYAGGCVRDRLMGLTPKDFDVATSATPQEVLQLFPRGQKVGAAFGVILVRQKVQGVMAQVEVATFRADGVYSDGRHPDSVRFTTAQEDAQRRDFTCNGLFFDPVAGGGAGVLHDFVGGQQDIAARTLRAIGRAEARFAEDHLRMLRAVRFAARLGFVVDAATMEAIRAAAARIKSVSRERVHDELARILSHETRARGAGLLEETGLLEEIWPGELLVKCVGDPRRVELGLSMIAPNSDFVVALVPLYKELAYDGNPTHVTPALAMAGAAVAELLRRELMLSNVETDDLAWLLDKSEVLLAWRSSGKAMLKRLMADGRWPRLENLFVNLSLNPGLQEEFLKRIAGLREEGVAPAPFVTGEALIRMGARPGPEFKGWLEALYDRQLEGELKTREEALAAAQRLLSKT